MAQHVQRNRILDDIIQSPFITIMVDEATDISNKEQLTFVIRSVNENFDVSEDFLGMYHILSTTSSSGVRVPVMRHLSICSSNLIYLKVTLIILSPDLSLINVRASKV